MCSIIGYRGKQDAARVLVGGLRRMEYRGYDSVGVATRKDTGITIKKGVGRVDEVNARLGLEELQGRSGIGHTRWATQGAATEANAHPHRSGGRRVAIVHNGSIENFAELRRALESAGHSFESETDSEVIANLLESELDGGGGPKGAIMRAAAALRGSYAFAAVFEDGTLAATRRSEPLIVGVGRDGYYVASDILGFIEHTDDVIYVKDGQIAVIGTGGLELYDAEGSAVPQEITKVSHELSSIYKGDYAHHTIKEITEQPDIIASAGGDPAAIRAAAAALRDAEGLYVVGSGSSHNAALIGRHLLLEHAQIRAEVIAASEASSHPGALARGAVLAISQSGESADIIEAVRLMRGAGLGVVSIVNHPHSSLARESSLIVRMDCGPEIGVAATKSFMAQLVVLYRIVAELGGPGLDEAALAHAVSAALDSGDGARKVASALRDISDVYVLGRGIHYPIAAEAALKLKELTYIHAEAILGGELKHGPLALLGPGAHAIVINPPGPTRADSLADAAKMRARGSRVIGIDTADADEYDYWIPIPEADEPLYPLVEIVPVQLLAYYTALERRTDPDHPRNLAKSVTVR